MKKLNLLIAILFVTALLAVPASHTRVYADAAGVSWGSSFQVLNLDKTQDASILIYYYNQDGSLATMADKPGTTTPYDNPVSDTVVHQTSNTYYPIHAAAGFNGSVMISSTVAVDVISNLVINTPQSALDSYDGVPSGGTSLFFPVAMKGNSNNNSSFSIQNTGGNSTNITVKFIGQPGTSYQTVTLPAISLNTGGSYTFDVTSNVPQLTDTKWVGSVAVTVANPATDSIAGVMNVINSGNSQAYNLASYNGISNGSTTVNLPLVFENNNRNRTSINCQNLDPTQTVTVTFKYTSGLNSSGTPYPARPNDVTPSIAPNGLALVIMDYAGTTKWVGSATVTASPSVNLACVVYQQNHDNLRLSSYLGLDPTTATPEVVFPLVMSRNGNSSNPASGYAYTSMNLAFVDGAVHPLTCTYYPAAGFTAPNPITITNSASPVVIQENVFGNGTKFVGSAICVSTDNTGLFGVANQTREWIPSSYAPAQRDVLSTYNGFNVTP